MVKEILKDKLNYDFHTLGYAKVASDYLGQGDKIGGILAGKSLEKILTKAGIADPWIVSTVTDPEVLKKTIENQLKTYNQCKQEETIGSLIDYFSGVFDGYSEGGASKVKEKLKDISGMTYGELSSEIEKIQDKIKGVKFGRTSKEDAEKAKKILETYQEVFSTIMLGESPGMSKFKSEIEYGFNKDVFKEMYFSEKKAA